MRTCALRWPEIVSTAAVRKRADATPQFCGHPAGDSRMPRAFSRGPEPNTPQCPQTSGIRSVDGRRPVFRRNAATHPSQRRLVRTLENQPVVEAPTPEILKPAPRKPVEMDVPSRAIDLHERTFILRSLALDSRWERLVPLYAQEEAVGEALPAQSLRSLADLGFTGQVGTLHAGQLARSSLALTNETVSRILRPVSPTPSELIAEHEERHTPTTGPTHSQNAPARSVFRWGK